MGNESWVLGDQLCQSVHYTKFDGCDIIEDGPYLGPSHAVMHQSKGAHLQQIHALHEFSEIKSLYISQRQLNCY